MSDLTPGQEEHVQRLRSSWGLCRPMPLPDGSVVAFCANEHSESTAARYLIPPKPNGIIREATPDEIGHALGFSLRHLRRPCPACGYPARRPACARCGTILP